MSGNIYRGGLDRWHDWLTAPHSWLLLGTQYAFNKDHDTVADVVDAEVTSAGYARLAVAGAVTAPVDVWFYGTAHGADEPMWSLPTGPGPATAQWLVLAYGGADATAGLLACWAFGPATSTEFTFTLPAWNDSNGDALPGGTASTALVHTRRANP